MDEVQAMPEEVEGKMKIWIGVVLVLVIVIVGALCYYFFSVKKNEKAAEVVATKEWVKQPEIVLNNTTSSDTHVLNGTTIRTYYLGNGKIEWAESTDSGKTFSAPTNTGITEENGMMISNPSVLQVSASNWIMLYEEQPQKKPGQEKVQTPPGKDTQRNLLLATSTDGKTFQKVGTVIDSSKEDNYFASVPDLVKVSDKKIRLYYVSGGEAIASADSSDGGKTWVRNKGYSLKDSAVDPDVVFENNGWTMYYSVLDTDKNAIYQTTSTDGLNWKNGTKIIERSNEVGSIVDPDVFEIGGQKIMFFGEFGSSSSTLGQESPNLYRAILETK